MMLKKKFKFLKSQKKNRTIDIPLKVLKFGHTGWSSQAFFVKNRRKLAYFFRFKREQGNLKSKNNVLKLNSRILKRNNNSNIIKRVGFSNMKTQASLKKWERLYETYANAMVYKRHFYQNVGSHVRYKDLKKQLFSNKLTGKDKIDFIKKLLKFEFRIDILLYRLRFFNSCREARSFLNRGVITVNSKPVKGNYYLQSGDIINTLVSLPFKKNLSSLKKNFLLRNYLEVDYYTNTIVILRSFNQIYKSEIPYFFPKYFDLQKFRYSFK